MIALNFAIIGAGNIGKIQAEAIEHIPEAKLAVVCNRGQDSGTALAKTHQAVWVADYQTAVAYPGVDVVSICTPSGSHMEIAIAAAQAGKHLLIEKPLDITLPRIDTLLEAVEKAGVVLACVFPRRFALGAQKTKEAVLAGRLGRLTLADAYVKWHRSTEYYETAWRGTWGLDGGGALMNQSIHYIDLLQWLAGPVATVFARTATLRHGIETEDTASAVLTFSNGAMGVIQGATSCWPGDKARLELHGTEGTIVLENGRIVVWELASATADEAEKMRNLEEQEGSGAADPTAIGYEMHRRQIVDLIEAIQQDRPPAIQGAEARRSVEIIRAIYHSAATEQVVSLPFKDVG